MSSNLNPRTVGPHPSARSSNSNSVARMAPRLIGCHIHDTRPPFCDHCPPFKGETSFDQLVPLLPKKCATVLKISPRAEAADIVEAANEWIKKIK